MDVVQRRLAATPVVGTGQQSAAVLPHRVDAPHCGASSMAGYIEELLDRIKTDQKPNTHEGTSKAWISVQSREQ
jgi:hypothetical protein